MTKNLYLKKNIVRTLKYFAVLKQSDNVEKVLSKNFNSINWFFLSNNKFKKGLVKTGSINIFSYIAFPVNAPKKLKYNIY